MNLDRVEARIEKNHSQKRFRPATLARALPAFLVVIPSRANDCNYFLAFFAGVALVDFFAVVFFAVVFFAVVLLVAILELLKPGRSL